MYLFIFIFIFIFISVPDDDVVMFMDAYDVLVFPAIVKTASMLAQSATPIVFCAERGVYPEMPGMVWTHMCCYGKLLWLRCTLFMFYPPISCTGCMYLVLSTN